MLRRRLRRLIVLVLALIVAAAGIYTVVTFIQRPQPPITERCTAVVGSQTAQLATDQSANAALITAVAVQRGLPPRAATIALATAMQESRLRNVSHGDEAGPDSRGLFQQRPSQGWGSEEQVMNPRYAANAFNDALLKVPDYESLEITDAAQQVQRSAYPLAYAKHEEMGRAFASALTGQAAGSLDCVLRAPEATGDPAALIEEITTAFGSVRASADGEVVELEVSGSHGWAVAQWAVANAKDYSITRVDVNGRTWSRQGRNGWQESGAAEGQITVTVAQPAAP